MERTFLQRLFNIIFCYKSKRHKKFDKNTGISPLIFSGQIDEIVCGYNNYYVKIA